MISPFEDQRSIFAVLDRQEAWGAFLAARLLGEAGAPQAKAGAPQAKAGAPQAPIAIRHMDNLEALDSCLVDSPMPVGVLLADDFAGLHELAWFVTRHARRPRTLLVVAGHTGNAEVGWLLRECGAHLVVESIEEVMMVARPLRRFFEKK